MAALVDAARATGLTYMLGETSYYYPSTLYCRERFRRGDFGRFVYGEAEYLHDTFLVLDSVEALTAGKQPPDDAWAAARYRAPGSVARESAKRGGELIAVPDFGDPPA